MKSLSVSLFLICLSVVLFFIPKVVLAHPGTLDERGGHACISDCAEWQLADREYHYHEETGAPMRTLDNNEEVFDMPLIDRVKGRILLRVEQNGEAWYVNPTDGLRTYMANGDDGYDLMRTTGLGITNIDLADIPAVDSIETMLQSTSVCSENTPARGVSGRILLQVESHGEAWYVSPVTCRRIYLQDGNAAFSLMRELSLGISDVDLAKLPMQFSYEGRFNYCGDRSSIPFDSYATPLKNQRLCYTAKRGETLQQLAMDFYGSAEAMANVTFVDEFAQLDQDGSLMPGTQLAFVASYFAYYAERNQEYPHWSYFASDFVIEPLSGMPILEAKHFTSGMRYDFYIVEIVRGVSENPPKIYASEHMESPQIRQLTYSPDWQHLSYILENTDSSLGCPGRDWQFVIDKVINPLETCGWDYELLTYSADGLHYAIRNNKEQNTDTDQFIVLSDIGNGPFYDFSDTLIWADTDTLVYRAHNDDVWRVVVNHQDVAIFDYLEDLRLEDGKIKFHARHDDGNWSDEEIVL